jgi:acyl-CoA synthetase (AMP-forming)/AMP-acid ligase II
MDLTHRLREAARRTAVRATCYCASPRQSRLARYKVPKRMLPVEELPRNTMGKVQ